MQQESGIFNKTEFLNSMKQEIVYVPCTVQEVMEKLKRYIEFDKCSADEIDSNYLEIMKLNFLMPGVQEKDLALSFFRISDSSYNNYLNPSESGNVIIVDESSQIAVSDNNIVQTIILILQGFSLDLELSEVEIENAYNEYFESLQDLLK